MSMETTLAQDFIIVVPYLPFSLLPASIRLKVKKLCFWYERKLEHHISDENLHLFIKHAGLYKASIYPDRPELGCYAIDNHISYENGEELVHEIYYNNDLVYCRS